jgi:hypothetical protein
MIALLAMLCSLSRPWPPVARLLKPFPPASTPVAGAEHV